MVDFVAVTQPAQNGNRVFHGRLVHRDRLKAPFQGPVLFHVLTILVQRGCPDAVQLATGQHRFQQIGGVHSALRRACAHHRMQLVNKQHHLALGLLDFFEHGFEPLLKLTPKFCAGNQRAHIQDDHPAVLQTFRHIAADDALRQPFHNGGLAHTRVTDQHRIVLGATRQHLYDPTDFIVPANHRVKLAQAGGLRQVPAIAFQGLIGALRVLIGHTLVAAHLLKRRKQAFPAQAVVTQQPARCALVVEHGEEQMLNAHVVVFEFPGFIFSAGERLRQALGDVHLVRATGRAGHLRKAVQQLFKLGGQRIEGHSGLSHERRNDAVGRFR